MSKVKITSLLRAMIEQGASDLHISAGSPPQYRIHGNMVKVKMPPLDPIQTKELCYSIMSDQQKGMFEREQELDCSFGLKNFARFRANVMLQKGTVAGVFRLIPFQIPPFESLGLPEVLRNVILAPNGLILVTGPTGSGKSTSLASMLDIINSTEKGHIVTIEDPIEYLHQHKQCVVNQREVGSDTQDFTAAFRRVLRQDPDFVLVGELRDLETTEMALKVAETGHLVFATLHTNSAVQTINRVISIFPPHQQGQIRTVLSFSLQAIVCQQLIPKSFEKGRVLACEVLIPTMGIRNLIREDKIHQVYSLMQSGQEETGMFTLNQHLLALVREGTLSAEDAMRYTTVPEELEKKLTTRAR